MTDEGRKIWLEAYATAGASLTREHMRNVRYKLLEIKCEVCDRIMSVGCCEGVQQTPLFKQLEKDGLK